MTNMYDQIRGDLQTLKEWSRNIIDKLPPAGSSVSDDLYLQNNAIQIGIVSQLEYFLKMNGKIRKQAEILDVIKHSSLQTLQKDHLIYLFLVRHTLVHNGGHYDRTFVDHCKSNIKELKIEGVEEGLLSSLPPDNLPMYVELASKLIDEIMRDR